MRSLGLGLGLGRGRLPIVGGGAGGGGQPETGAEITVLEADSLALSDQDSVATWGDVSGNGHDATTVGGDPVYVENVVNGLPVVRFTRSQADVMEVVLGAEVTPPWVLLFVAHERSGFDTQSRFLVRGGNTFAYVNGNDLIVYAGSTQDVITGGQMRDGFHAVDIRGNAGDPEFTDYVHLDGAQTFAGHFGNSGWPTTLYLGAESGGSNPGDWDIAAWILLERGSLVETDFQQAAADWRNYLLTKYGIA